MVRAEISSSFRDHGKEGSGERVRAAVRAMILGPQPLVVAARNLEIPMTDCACTLALVEIGVDLALLGSAGVSVGRHPQR